MSTSMETDDQEDAPKASKFAGVLPSIKLPKKAKNLDGDADDAEQAEVVAQDTAPKASGILAGLGKFKKVKSEAVEEETMSLEQSFEVQIDTATNLDDMPEMDPAFMTAKLSMMARFDTPLMGVVAVLAVSFVGLVGASVLFG